MWFNVYVADEYAFYDIYSGTHLLFLQLNNLAKENDKICNCYIFVPINLCINNFFKR